MNKEDLMAMAEDGLAMLKKWEQDDRKMAVVAEEGLAMIDTMETSPDT
jgi:hypothetical protein